MLGLPFQRESEDVLLGAGSCMHNAVAISVGYGVQPKKPIVLHPGLKRSPGPASNQC